MNERSKIIIETLFRKADNDYNSALRLIGYEPLILDTAAFHCQQAIKYLKAYLVFKEVDFPKTHNLESLLDLIVSSDATFYAFHFLELTSFAVEIRYADDYIIPDVKEKKTYLKIIERVKETVTSKIKL